MVSAIHSMSPWPTVMLAVSMMDSCSLCWPCLTEFLSFPPSAFFNAQEALSSPDWASLEVGRKRGPGGWTSMDRCAYLPSFNGVIWKHIIHVPPAELSPVTHSSNPLNSTPFIAMSPYPLLFSHPLASMSRITPRNLLQSAFRGSQTVTCPEVTALMAWMYILLTIFLSGVRGTLNAVLCMCLFFFNFLK